MKWVVHWNIKTYWPELYSLACTREKLNLKLIFNWRYLIANLFGFLLDFLPVLGVLVTSLMSFLEGELAAGLFSCIKKEDGRRDGCTGGLIPIPGNPSSMNDCQKIRQKTITRKSSICVFAKYLKSIINWVLFSSVLFRLVASFVKQKFLRLYKCA